MCAFDNRHQRIAVRRRKHYAVHAAADHIFDNVDLAGNVRFLRGTFPDNVHAKVFAGGVRACFDALPEMVRDAFGNDGDFLLTRSAGASTFVTRRKNNCDEK